MKVFQKKLLSASVSTALTLAICSAIPASLASDISIYSDAQKGKTRILLMLDTSGSMGISSLVLPRSNKFGSPGDVDSSLCDEAIVSEDGTSFKEWTYNLKSDISYGFRQKSSNETVAANKRFQQHNNSGTGRISYNGKYYSQSNNGDYVKFDLASGTPNAPKEERPAIYKEVMIDGEVIPYYLRGCSKGGITQYDRLSRLKDAVIQLLASNDLSDDVQIGLGHFSAKTDINIGNTANKLVDGHSGRILVPMGQLTKTQRKALVKQLASLQSVDTTTNGDGTANSNLKLTSTSYPNIFKASSGTPTAHAYAEAGAYMMGTSTGKYPRTLPSNTTVVYDGYAVIKNNQTGHADFGKQFYYVCVGLDGNSGDGVPGTRAQFCDNEWNRGMDKSGEFWDSANKRPGNDVKIYKPNLNADDDPATDDDWLRVTPVEFHTQFNNANNVWELHQKLPYGWRWGGWLKVEQEPMDIEPIGTKVWDHHPKHNFAIKNMVSYRSSPFSLETTSRNDDTPFENYVGGMAYSVPTSKTADGSKYVAGGSKSQCDGNGIYFLTDGAPNSTKDAMAQAIMNESLFDAKYKFAAKPTGDILKSPKLQSGVFANETGGWEYIGAYAKKLKSKTLNPGEMTIKTAVVGFGSSFEELKETQDCEALIRANSLGYNKDAYNACKWGSEEYGGGGFYYAENSDDIVKSILDFVRKVEVEIKPVATGTPTIPVDALNPTTLQNEAYYASFQPTVSSASQMWAGNLNKYKIKNGELFSADDLQRLFDENGALNEAAQGFWTGGVLGQLPFGANISVDGETTTHRKIFTNRAITESQVVSSNQLRVVDVNALFDGDFKTDQDKMYWLNALGYDIKELPSSFTKENLSTYATGKKLGAVMHSTPVLLTQEGRVIVNNNTLNTDDRKDYLMYGSTQGILHIVDVSTGKEVFGFLPHEMMEKQKAALLLDDKTAGGMSNLYYGIDAPWVAHTQYTTKNDGLLTVKESDRTQTGEDDSDAFLKGHQWVYGGLRMGGKSYYALNLTDINNPEMLFHINPEDPNSSAPLKRMGQSWSKPTLGYVNWGGNKKLVMFVGGGYDAEGEVTCTADPTATNKGYECPTYQQTNKVGAGVYMFDAQNGELLWWTSADKNDTPDDSEIRFTENTDLQYSVVSQINAIDRNSDGLVDHLYFGDLAGQAFRVDINNAPSVETLTGDDAEEKTLEATKDAFAKRTVTLFTEHQANGLSPRFYEMPSITLHTDVATGEIFLAASFSSGNRSTPLADSTQSANDGVFVVYDNDAASKNLYEQSYVLKTTKANSLMTLNLQNGVTRRTGDNFNAGWKHTFSSVAGTYKGMNDIYALDGMLYVNVFHKDGAGISGDCGGGVKGDSYLYQYCLPYGNCDFYTSATTSPNRVKLGAGILGTGIGQGYNNKISTLGLIVNRDDPKAMDCSKPEYKNLPQCQLFDNTVKLQQLRWYESR